MYQPALYSDNNNCAVRSAQYLVNKYGNLINWKKNESVIEIGLGDGRASNSVLVPLLPQDLKEYVGTDISAIMLRHAKKVIVVERSRFEVLDIVQDIPPEFENSFDHVFSFLLFHWIKETKTALQNMYKMLKPGGETFNLFFAEAPSDRPFDNMLKNPKWAKYETERHASPYYTNPNILEIYRMCLSEAGFVDCVVQPDEYLHKFGTAKEYQDLLTAVNPTVAKIPSHRVDEYLQDYFNEFKKSPIWSFKQLDNGEEEVEFTMKYIVMYGKKPDK